MPEKKLKLCDECFLQHPLEFLTQESFCHLMSLRVLQNKKKNEHKTCMTGSQRRFHKICQKLVGAVLMAVVAVAAAVVATVAVESLGSMMLLVAGGCRNIFIKLKY
jgi:hypothetical protein